MITKTVGIIILLCMGLYLCITFSVFERRRLEQCGGFLLLLRHIRAQISCFRTPPERIWASFEDRELSRCGFLPALRRTGSFSQALTETEKSIWLGEDERALLHTFSGELGQGYAEEQLAGLDYYISEFEKAYSDRRATEPSRSRLYRSLFVTGTLMVVIILI